ncbi:MAG: hypothetical protein IJE19_06080 [Clostridia bacterium]|nr:hypothetical protein [Clostridia bacterium]
MAWIWLDEKKFPEFQKNHYNVLYDCENDSSEEYNYCVADFFRSFEFKKSIKSVKFRVSADNTYILNINSELIGIGPASAGGDFLCRGAAPKHYADKYEIEFADDNPDKIDITAKVCLQPEMLTGYSRGHGGFFFEGTLIFTDGTTENIETDSSWLASPDYSYNGFRSYDSGKKKCISDSYASEIEDIWSVEDSFIPPRSYNEVFYTEITVGVGKTETFKFELDKIYGVHPVISSCGMCDVTLMTSELEGQERTEEKMIFGQPDGDYFSFRMHSAGMMKLIVKNTDSADVQIRISLIAPWYPIVNEGAFTTSSEGLNKVYDVCKHTLKICRQTLHLDSTKHQELLACTSDYNIESLMTLFCFGDMRLAEFDLMRTADWLVANDGVMFHTTYSLIWVQMLHNVYMITGMKQILHYCKNALDVLLQRFDSYIGENEIIDNPPDFMFVDWTVIDGFSMHHPPKALGQTVLNCFYYKALIDASKIYSFIGEDDTVAVLSEKAEKFRIRFNEVFFDKDRMLYFDGLGTPYGDGHHYRPANVDKKYFSKYPNILAPLYGLCDTELSVDILERIIFDDMLQDIQPYFMHYLLNAVRKYNLFDKYGMKLLERWIPVVTECDKGLAEGWIAPEKGYSFDHSHAWGGTPAYQMPMAITGLEILEPGMKKIKFTPNLYGLDFAEIKIPTEYGMIYFKAEKGKETIFEVPDGIELVRG